MSSVVEPDLHHADADLSHDSEPNFSSQTYTQPKSNTNRPGAIAQQTSASGFEYVHVTAYLFGCEGHKAEFGTGVQTFIPQ